jgi:NADH-quinone oxidoreductase subunit C
MDATLLERLQAALGVEPQNSHGMPVVGVEPAQWLGAIRTLRDALGFDMLLDLTAVDWLGRQAGQPRFEVVAHLLSTKELQRVRVKTRVEEGDPAVDSLVPLFGSAAFMERECHEMFGIRFAGNADLRPILLYEGFVGHPLRKDYPKEREQPLIPYRDA